MVKHERLVLFFIYNKIDKRAVDSMEGGEGRNGEVMRKGRKEVQKEKEISLMSLLLRLYLHYISPS